MIKQVIRFDDGTYWECFGRTTRDLQKAWTFNKVSGAEITCNTNELKNYTIVPVKVFILVGNKTVKLA